MTKNLGKIAVGLLIFIILYNLVGLSTLLALTFF